MDSQVAVYIDFDNIVMSRYDELHGAQAWRNDRAGSRSPTRFVQGRLVEARVDLAAIMDYAASFGRVTISRAYANWATPVNASYSSYLMRSSIDLVQLFPLTQTKNGADIRLAIDVIDDLSTHRHITHVLVVAGDSDYVSLAQRCKRLGRHVIGVGAFSSVGQYWEVACDEYRYYGNLPTLTRPAATSAPGAVVIEGDHGTLLLKAARLLHARTDGDWLAAGGLKSVMARLDPAFDEATDGFATFTAFLHSHPDLVSVKVAGNTWARLVELGPAADAAAPHLGNGADSATVPNGAVSPTLSNGAHSATVPNAAPSALGQAAVSAIPPAPAQPGTAQILRKNLGFARVDHVSEPLEELAVRAVRLAWQLCDPALGRKYERLPWIDIRDALVGQGSDADLAEKATSVALSIPILLRESDMVMQPSPEMAGDSNGQIRAHLRAGFLERVRNGPGGADASLAEVVEAIHGSHLPPERLVELVGEYESYDAWPGWRRLAEAIGPLLMPAPVLWDVAAAMVAVSGDVDLASADALAAALADPLHEMDRDPDSIPFDAAYMSLVAGGAIVRSGERTLFVLAEPDTDTDTDTPDVAAVIVRAWIGRCAEAGLGVMPEALGRLVLPDRHQIIWRAWVRDLLESSEAERGAQ